jgi:hypothetical protein
LKVVLSFSTGAFGFKTLIVLLPTFSCCQTNLEVHVFRLHRRSQTQDPLRCV